MARSIRYINFSGDYHKFDEWKERKINFQTQGHPKIPEKEVEVPTEDEA